MSDNNEKNNNNKRQRSWFGLFGSSSPPKKTPKKTAAADERKPAPQQLLGGQRLQLAFPTESPQEQETKDESPKNDAKPAARPTISSRTVAFRTPQPQRRGPRPSLRATKTVGRRRDMGSSSASKPRLSSATPTPAQSFLETLKKRKVDVPPTQYRLAPAPRALLALPAMDDQRTPSQTGDLQRPSKRSRRKSFSPREQEPMMEIASPQGALQGPTPLPQEPRLGERIRGGDPTRLEDTAASSDIDPFLVYCPLPLLPRSTSGIPNSSHPLLSDTDRAADAQGIAQKPTKKRVIFSTDNKEDDLVGGADAVDPVVDLWNMPQQGWVCPGCSMVNNESATQCPSCKVERFPKADAPAADGSSAPAAESAPAVGPSTGAPAAALSTTTAAPAASTTAPAPTTASTTAATFGGATSTTAPPPGGITDNGFRFGAVAAATSAPSTGSSGTGFNVGTASATTSAPSTGSSGSGFTFGTAAAGISFGTAAAATSAPSTGFTFGTPSPAPADGAAHAMGTKPTPAATTGFPGTAPANEENDKKRSAPAPTGNSVPKSNKKDDTTTSAPAPSVFNAGPPPPSKKDEAASAPAPSGSVAAPTVPFGAPKADGENKTVAPPREFTFGAAKKKEDSDKAKTNAVGGSFSFTNNTAGAPSAKAPSFSFHQPAAPKNGAADANKNGGATGNGKAPSAAPLFGGTATADPPAPRPPLFGQALTSQPGGAASQAGPTFSSASSEATPKMSNTTTPPVPTLGGTTQPMPTQVPVMFGAGTTSQDASTTQATPAVPSTSTNPFPSSASSQATVCSGFGSSSQANPALPQQNPFPSSASSQATVCSGFGSSSQANPALPQQQPFSGSGPFANSNNTSQPAAPMFGSSNVAPVFGATRAQANGFGNNNNGTQQNAMPMHSPPPNAFGAPAPSNASSYGGFTSPPAPNGFGSTTSTPGFGAPAPSFGATSAFGAAAPTPAGPAFGAPTPAAAPFGFPAAPAAQANTGNPFNTSGNQTQAGFPAPATTFGFSTQGPLSDFGPPAPAPPGGFGAAATPSFGNTATPAAPGGFSMGTAPPKNGALRRIVKGKRPVRQA